MSMKEPILRQPGRTNLRSDLCYRGLAEGLLSGPQRAAGTAAYYDAISNTGRKGVLRLYRENDPFESKFAPEYFEFFIKVFDRLRCDFQPFLEV